MLCTTQSVQLRECDESLFKLKAAHAPPLTTPPERVDAPNHRLDRPRPRLTQSSAAPSSRRMYAASSGHLNIVKTLLTAKARVDDTDERGAAWRQGRRTAP